jgi:hypothetical protein
MSSRSDAEVSDLLRSALTGDPSTVADLREVPHEQIRTATESIRCVLGADAVRAVLSALRSGSAEADVQAWASFMRRGYVEGSHSRGIRPIDIEYEPIAEDAIVEAISRMDELGDAIDGSMSIEEIDALTTALERSATSA